MKKSLNLCAIIIASSVSSLLFIGCKKENKNNVTPAVARVTTLVSHTSNLYYPSGIVVDADGTFYECEQVRGIVQKITSSGVVTTLAGSGAIYGTSNDGIGTKATFEGPAAITFDNQDNLLVTDFPSGLIRKVTLSGAVTTLKVANNLAGDALKLPTGIAIDADNNIFTADLEHITKLDVNGTLTIFADAVKVWPVNGNPNETVTAWAYCLKADRHGNLFAIFGNVICSIEKNGTITPIAGAPQGGYQDGKGTAAKFKNPTGLAIDNAGNIYVTDTGNHLIRKIDGSGEVTTVAGDVNTTQSIDGAGAHAGFDTPGAICIDGDGVLYVGDVSEIRKIVIE